MVPFSATAGEVWARRWGRLATAIPISFGESWNVGDDATSQKGPRFDLLLAFGDGEAVVQAAMAGMAAGAIVIAINSDDLAAIVADGKNGLLVAEPDAEAIAARLLEIVSWSKLFAKPTDFGGILGLVPSAACTLEDDGRTIVCETQHGRHAYRATNSDAKSVLAAANDRANARQLAKTVFGEKPDAAKRARNAIGWLMRICAIEMADRTRHRKKTQPDPKAKSLAELTEVHRTDKVAHGYLPHYERHFGPLRGRPLHILEIGIGPGGSLPLWHDYFPQALVLGIDINEKPDYPSPRIRVYRGDQADAEFLRRVVEENGGVDIVIDDGSHVSSDVLASFRTLFPLLNEGGLYVIEDIHVSYWTGFGGNFRDLSRGGSTAIFIKNLIDGLNCHWIPGREPADQDLTIDAVHCYPKLAFISKGNNPKVQRPYEIRMMQESLDKDRPSIGVVAAQERPVVDANAAQSDPLLIATAVGPSPLTRQWYELQKRFIVATTTRPFKFWVYLDGADAKDFDDDDIIEASATAQGHVNALQRLMVLLKGRRNSACLILDNDCFPVHKGWHDVLFAQMQRFGKQIATPVRTENLDLFPHPCAVFLLPAAMETIAPDFFQYSPVKNLLGEDVEDVRIEMAQQSERLLPMLRTNVHNLHPVAAAIYHHLFYHHGAGSRYFAFRVLKRFAYYDHWYDIKNEQMRKKELLEGLLQDPGRFIGFLMGLSGSVLKSDD